MPYIAFDLDALEEVPNVARAAGVEEGAVALGLLRTWRHCWREETDMVSRARLRGFFGADVASALVEFGFLEVVGEAFRVKGADRYLRLQETWRKAGKASALARKARSTAVQALSLNGRSTDVQRAFSPQPSGLSPEGLSASSEQHLKDIAGKPASPAKKANPNATGWAELVANLKADFEQLVGGEWSPLEKDFAALKAMRKRHADAEIRAHWQWALPRPDFPGVANLAQLNSHWDAVTKHRKRGGRGEEVHPTCELITG